MKIAIYSDTHNLHRQFPLKEKVDILFHCGDFTGLGRPGEISEFKQWCDNLLNEEMVDEIVIIPGNHDLLFEKDERFARALMTDPQIHILIDQTIELKGLKIHGSPWTPIFFDWAFMEPEDKLARRWRDIPNDIDILVTHGPALGHLDSVSRPPGRAGSAALAEVIACIKPLYHLCGHLHNDGGRIKEIYYGEYGGEQFTTIVNAACLDDNYKPRKNVPVILNIE